MRRGEILGLRWLDIDLAQGRVMLPQTKNGEGRIVYLNEGAQASVLSYLMHAFSSWTKLDEKSGSVSSHLPFNPRSRPVVRRPHALSRADFGPPAGVAK